jgi:hypothetical protein
MAGKNSGITISGGTVNAGAMAAGKGAVASNVALGTSEAALADVRRRLDQLAQELRTRVSELDDPDQTLTVVDLARKEAAKKSPNKGTLQGLLKTLTSVVGDVASFGTSIASIVSAVSTIFAG